MSMKLYTLPDEDMMDTLNKHTPDYMLPNRIPYAAVIEGALTGNECQEIVHMGMFEEPYRLKSCGAETRELKDVPHLDKMAEIARWINDFTWDLKLDDHYAPWLQTYYGDDEYKTHMDSAPGQSRKLTAVAMLTDPVGYMGGDLIIEPPPFKWYVPKTIGTVVVFLPWLLHTVTPITEGTRQTVNMGFYGPPLR
jgi:hypothetical protein